MRAMILAAGVGSRLDPLTRNCPKPLVPIVNRPVMEYLILLLKQHGFNDIMVNVHYLGDQIAQYFGDGSRWDVRIHWSHEDELWGDAGSVKRVQAFFQNDTFLVIGGDDLTDMDLTAVVQTHTRKKATATLALSIVDDPSEYGIVQLDDNGRITRFLEKPRGEVFSNTANTGVYVFEPKVFDLIPADTFFLFGKQLFPLLMEYGLPMYGHVTQAYWKDVGNLKVYRETQSDVLEGRVNALLPLHQAGKNVWKGDNVHIDPTAHIGTPVAIGSNVHIGANARIGDHTVIGDNCRILDGATVNACILWEGATVQANTYLERCIVGKNSRIETNTAIFDGIIADPNRPMTVV
jgi:NDP-sugar pyrophosphorylase family protein